MSTQSTQTRPKPGPPVRRGGSVEHTGVARPCAVAESGSSCGSETPYVKINDGTNSPICLRHIEAAREASSISEQ